MNEFEPHDYFTGISEGYTSREVLNEHVRKTYDQIRELADYIDQMMEEFEENERARESAESMRMVKEEERTSKDGERDNKIEVVEGVVDDVSSKLDNKANKKQEDWITPTLLNGATGTIKYRKNELGNTEISGRLTVVNSGTALVLPVGYRISDSRIFIVSNNIPNNTTSFKLYITNSGGLSISNASEGTFFISVTLI